MRRELSASKKEGGRCAKVACNESQCERIRPSLLEPDCIIILFYEF